MKKTENIFDVFNNACKELINKENGIFADLFNVDTKKMLEDFKTKLANISKNGYKREVTFEYDGPMTADDRKNVIINKMNKWTKLAIESDSKTDDILVTFKFGKEDTFYFTWDADLKKFMTTDPNGDVFYYDDKDQTLVKIVDDKKDDKKDEQPAGVRCDVKDNTVQEKKDEDEVAEGSRYGFDVKDDKNLAFNLRNSLAEWHEKNNGKSECDDIFCPFEAADNFYETIIKGQVFGSDFDDEGNPYQINFDVEWFLPDFDSNEERVDCLTEIYHEESQNLDKFCELVKDKYNFSMGCYNVTFNDDKSKVKEIEFVFTF